MLTVLFQLTRIHATILGLKPLYTGSISRWAQETKTKTKTEITKEINLGHRYTKRQDRQKEDIDQDGTRTRKPLVPETNALPLRHPAD